MLDESGALIDEVHEIIDAVAAGDMTLATGHLSALGIMKLVPEARRRGVERVIITHPEMACIGLDLADQRELADRDGLWFERVFVLTLPPFDGSIDHITRTVQE